MSDFPQNVFVALRQDADGETLLVAFRAEDFDASDSAGGVACYRLEAVGAIERTFVAHPVHTLEQRVDVVGAP